MPDKSKAPPEPSEVVVCFHCGTILIFDELLILRRASTDEINELHPVDRAVAITAARQWSSK